MTAATYDSTGGGIFGNSQNATGFFFTPTLDILVDQLGVFSASENSFLFSPHDVGIFLLDGTPRAFTTILPGGGSQHVGDGRFERINPVILFADTPYYILANNFQMGDQFVSGDLAVNFDPAIAWNGIADASKNDIFDHAVSNDEGMHGNLGPNFLFDPLGAIPEPSTFVLFSLGSFGLLYLAWRRRSARLCAFG
jgi:hypothetical protein